MRISLKLLLLILFTLLASTVMAEVYKRTLPDGTVEFTDRPPTQDAQPIELGPINTVPARPKRDSGSTAATSADETVYQDLVITSPKPEETIRENNGNLTVTVSVTPSLASGHRVVVVLDGSKQVEGATTSLSFTNIDRGSHSLRAMIVDAADKTLISSGSVTFFMRRASQLLSPQDSETNGTEPAKVPAAPLAPMMPQAPKMPAAN